MSPPMPQPVSRPVPQAQPTTSEIPAAPDATSCAVEGSAAARAVVADLARRHDPDRWWATLWAPAEARPHLHALIAFSAEIARIRDVVSDPLPGEVRVRWWADMLAGRRGGEGAGHPVAACLGEAIARFGLPLDRFDRLLEARIFDLYDDPMPSLAELETYCDDTAGELLTLMAHVLAGRDVSAEAGAALVAAGRAWGLTGLLRAFAFHASRGQIFLPQDRLDAHGVDRADILAGRSSPGLKAVLAELADRARADLAEMRAHVREVPPEAACVLLPLGLVEPILDRMGRADHDPFRSSAELPAWLRIWRLWRAAGAATRCGAA